MGTAERKEREKAQRREDIINAAERVFFAKGFDSSSVDDVAQEAELSKGTLYLYFSGKDELGAAVKLRGLRLMRTAFAAAVKNAGSGLEKIGAVGHAFNLFFQQYPQHAAFLHQTAQPATSQCEREAAPYQLRCMKEAEQAFQLMVDAIICGQQDGSIRTELDPRATALALSNFSEGILQAVSASGNAISALSGQTPEQYVNFAFSLMGAALES